jgi:hypothetical protein
VQSPPLGVLLEPAAQARPFAQQRLVRDSTSPSPIVIRRSLASADSAPPDA